MAGINLQFKGLQALEKKINGLPIALLEEIDAEIEKGVQTIVQKQKQNAPKNYNRLGQGNQYERIGLANWKIFNDVDYSVYVEFGTKGNFKQDSRLSGNVFQPKKRSSNVSFYDSILDWVKKKGIAARYSVKTRKRLKSTASDDKRERQAAFLIMRHIKKYGVKAQPFFFPAWFEERPKINKNIGNAIRRVMRK